MQIRLTVLGPRSGQTERQDRPAAATGPQGACDVLVTAPAGTALAAVASGLATTVAGSDAPLVLYAGPDRLDAQRCTLGEPPLIDGAVLSLGAPAEPGPELAGAAAQLHVVAGPDAGGVHLLHGGRIQVGRSADADVPLDDPDVSRMHCAVTLTPDGRVTVTDLGSTNGTAVDGLEVTDRPVRLSPGSLLRIGESALRLTDGVGGPASGAGTALATAPDGEGHVRVRPAGTAPPTLVEAAPNGSAAHHAYGPAGWGAAGGTGTGSGGAGTYDTGAQNAQGAYGAGPAHGAQSPYGAYGTQPAPVDHGMPGGVDPTAAANPVVPHQGSAPDTERTRTGTPARGTTVPRNLRKRGGLSAWARRLKGGREGDQGHDPYDGPDGPDEFEEYGGYGEYGEYVARDGHGGSHGTYADGGHAGDRGAGPLGPSPEDLAITAAARTPEAWPDPAALLLTALGPGPRLWERGPGHPEALAVRLGTVDRALPAADGREGLLPAVPVTVGLREAGSLGLAGPRDRLTGLARAVVAQLAALHSPDSLEIVLISTDRARPTAERTAEWAWLGWLPHLRPAHGQDCRLLLAYDRDQAAARTDELIRRLDDHIADSGTGHAGTAPTGARTVVVVDGDPGSAALRESTVRLAGEGARAGIHVVCLAETVAASPASPVLDTYEAACAVAPAFRACGAVALLSGDVATALRLMRTAGGRPAGHGTVAAVDAVSAAWAERFARALAPLRTDGTTGEGHARVSAPLPQSARLLDELGLARATPASLMARWAAAADDPEALGGRATAVLGAGPRGPVVADLGAEGPHLLAEGPAGSGRTELLRSVAASLAAAERPDRLGIVLVDGRDGVGAGGAVGRQGTGLGVCTDLPHVTTHLVANDPVRMRAFAQSLAAELKRRAELLGRLGFAEWHTRREVSGRMVTQRSQSSAPATTTASTAPASPRSDATTSARSEAATPASARPETTRSGNSPSATSHPTNSPSVPSARSGATPSATHPTNPTSPASARPEATRPTNYPPANSPSGNSRPTNSTSPASARPEATHPTNPTSAATRPANSPSPASTSPAPPAPSVPAPSVPAQGLDGDLDPPPSATMRLRPASARQRVDPGPPLPRLVVLVDDFDALLSPALGSPGRPAAGSVVRALEAVARDGERLGVHLVATTGRSERVLETELGQRASLHVVLDAVASGPEEPAPGRGELRSPDGRATAFQAGRVTGRIPRTATLRPTVVPLEWERMGDPPARRPVRELGNGPTDLALLASALERAARSVSADQVPSLL
ncbi:cell division protein FtsK [Streptomyces venezuelae]|uniref:Cell division protein FtsK n=1 Tax=Streptomyces venezuelae TaxID=54571 RepID=A0A5P2CHF3_STRVZ|nr:FHA domain-containing protein [Streptomyces venezuelae]QES41903.1 cell division protein FtsK [Streptomyces venezuelae]